VELSELGVKVSRETGKGAEMKSNDDVIVYQDMAGHARVIEQGEDYVAQTLVTGRSDRWRHASAPQALGLIKKALSVARLQKDDPVIAWDGSKVVRGTYVERRDRHVVKLGTLKYWYDNVLPLKVAVQDGLWPFTDGLSVAAWVNEDWVKATWRDYEYGLHVVELESSRWEAPRDRKVRTDRAHSLQDAVRMGLLHVVTPEELRAEGVWNQLVGMRFDRTRTTPSGGSFILPGVPEESNEPLYLSFNEAQRLGVHEWKASNSGSDRDVLPRKRRSFQKDLSLLAPMMKVQGRIRGVAENGVMIRFTVSDREFEGLALFKSMTAQMTSQIEHGQIVTFRIVVARHENYGIPVLEIITIDSSLGNR
jgi:hypothetical protein